MVESGAEAGGDERLGRPFWRLWSAGVINNLGDGALTIGVGLLAATLTSDPRLVAAVSAASTLPWLLVTLPAGVLVDRTERIRTIRAAQLLQAAAMAALTVLAVARLITIVELAAFAFLVTTGTVVAGLASQSVLPQLVDKKVLVKANSLTYLGQTLAYSFAGQSLGGILFTAASALPFGFETLSYLGSAALLTRLRPRSEAAPRPRDGRVLRTLGRDIAEGVRWLSHHRLLRTLAIVLGVNNFANQLGLSVLVLFALRTLGVSHAEFGWMLAASAIGGVLGGIANTRLVRLIGTRAALIGSLAANAACYGLIGFAGNGFEVSALIAVVGFSVTVWNVISVTLRQTLVPEELLGRVNSVYRLIGWGLLPLGAVAGGFTAHWLGLRSPFLVTSALRFLVLILTAPVLVTALRVGRGPAPSPRGHNTP